MAITNVPLKVNSVSQTVNIGPAISNSWLNTYDHAIQGKMIIARQTVSDVDIQDMILSPDSIKKMLVEKLVSELWKNDCIEFTKIEDPSMGNYTFTARIFVTPDTQVRILRQAGK